MPAYSYQALNPEGRTVTGTVEADNAKSARTRLRAQELIPLQVTALVGEDARPAAAWATRLFTRRAYSAAGLSIWTRQLAELVNAGLPLERALSSLSEEADVQAQRHVTASLRAEVNAGSSFAKALAQHPREFAPVYIAVVGAGEQGGELGVVLERLADELEEREALKAKLLGAALYPAIVTLVAIAIVTFLVSYVVPQVAQVFAGVHRSLPWLTVLMLGVSRLVREWGWLALVLLAMSGIALQRALTVEHLRRRFDAAWLQLPLIGRLARGYNAARFAGALAMLSAAGVPILRALQAAAETLSNHAMREDALQALAQVREGAPLAAALAQKKRFPALLAMFARLGEQTGAMPQMLQRAAHQLSSEVQRRAMQLATLLEPLLIVAMGLIVMLIVLAVLLPIIQLNQWVR